MTTLTREPDRKFDATLALSANASIAPPSSPALTAYDHFLVSSAKWIEVSSILPLRERYFVITSEELPDVSLGLSPRFQADERLWSILCDYRRGLDIKLDALRELAERHSPRLVEFIISSLLNLSTRFPLRSELTYIAEGLAVEKAEDRLSLANALHFNAKKLRNHNDDAADFPLWSAIRKLGGLIEPEQGDLLLDFLRDEDKIQTRQVALQAVQSLATSGCENLPSNLKDRVSQLALSYANLEWLCSAERIALAANAIAAATLANVSSLNAIFAKTKALNRPLLNRQIHLSITRSGGSDSTVWSNFQLKS